MKSMTGYGRGVATDQDVEIVTEIRSVNHRFLDISFRSPKIYTSFEPKLRKIVMDSISRGKIEINISRNGGKSAILGAVLDEKLAESYYSSLKRMKDLFNLSGEITISDMLTLREVIAPVENEAELERDYQLVIESLKIALSALDSMRSKEGETIWNDIQSRLESIKELSFKIEPLVDQVTKSAKEKLEKRVTELLGAIDLDRERLAQEVAYMADKSDITEELVRVRSHVDQFRDHARKGSPIGRKLDFLLQELHREVNTISSKSSSTDISSVIVTAKAEVEKIREQTQNIE